MKTEKVNFGTVLIVLVLILSMGGCDDSFLEVKPKGSLIAKDTRDYDLLLNNLDLVNLRGNAMVILSPDACSLDPYYSGETLRFRNAFGWQEDIYQPNDDMTEITDYMEQIYIYNKIINEVPGSTEGTEEKKSSVRGEALTGRAWSYFQLINFFAKPYNSATAADDPGFPIITEANVTGTDFTRQSVQEVYDLIIEDLSAAIPLLPVDITHRLRASKGVAQGLLGKVYVFMGRYEDAIPLLEDAMATFASQQGLPARLYDYNETTQPEGVHEGGDSPLLPDNIESPYGKQVSNSYGGRSNSLLVPPSVSSLYSSSDYRFTEFMSTTTRGGDPIGIPDVYRRIQGGSTTPIGLVIPDVALLIAEIKARTGDLTGAETDLEDFRAHRMPPEDAGIPDGLSQDELIKFVINERRREFFIGTHYWFTIRRLSLDPLFENEEYTHTVYNADGSVGETFTLTEERMVLQFNEKILAQNPGLENNP